MKLEDLKHVSESTRQRNPTLFGVGGLRNPKSKQDSSRSNASKVRRQAGRKTGVDVGHDAKPRVLVTITSYRRHLLDSDNFQGGAKPLRDAIATSLKMDDADSIIQWQYSQVKTNGQPGVIVMIERVK